MSARLEPDRGPTAGWDSREITTALKTATGPCADLVAGAYGECVKPAVIQACPSLPRASTDASVDAATKKATEYGKKAMDKSVDSAYQTPSSWGSRVVDYLRSWF